MVHLPKKGRMPSGVSLVRRLNTTSTPLCASYAKGARRSRHHTTIATEGMSCLSPERDCGDSAMAVSHSFHLPCRWNATRGPGTVPLRHLDRPKGASRQLLSTPISINATSITPSYANTDVRVRVLLMA